MLPICKARSCWLLAALAVWCLALPACNKAEHSSEREKLSAERLELERQRVEIERQKREAVEAQVRDKQAAERAQEYTADEFRLFKDQIERSADSVGRLLLRGTHPTGTYGNTASPFLTLSSDRRDITVSVTVYWKGGFSESPYETAYSCNLNKKEGVGTLKVIRDTALIKIDPQFLRSTEYSLKEMFKPGR